MGEQVAARIVKTKDKLVFTSDLRSDLLIWF